ncbi:hypothetical protein [Profundibacter sp.]|uniref:hypothetical protein n=1 Tax=Profundibacter sp. TaxID=3101071 RepID=UPI003D09B7B8
MAHTAQTPEIQIRKAGFTTGRVFYLGLMAVALIVAAVFVPDPVAGLIMIASGMTLGFVGLAVMVRAYWKVRVQKADIDTLAGIVGNDASPCFITDLDDEIIYGNLCKFPFSPSSRRGGRFFACPA